MFLILWPGLMLIVFTSKGSLVEDLLLEKVRTWQVSALVNPQNGRSECEIHSVVHGTGNSSGGGLSYSCTCFSGCFPNANASLSTSKHSSWRTNLNLEDTVIDAGEKNWHNVWYLWAPGIANIGSVICK